MPPARSRFAARLVIMVKEPVAGRVKTRLALGIGAAAAASVYRAMVTALVARLSADPRWQTVLAVSPDAAILSRMLPRQTSRVAQASGDLGRRLQDIFDQLPPGPVVVIGSDIPAITGADIASAFNALGRHDAVFGPSPDGGYWLIGMKRRPCVLRPFNGVRWSSEHALADTRRNLEAAPVAYVAVRDDIDTAADLARLRAHTGRRVLPRRFENL